MKQLTALVICALPLLSCEWQKKVGAESYGADFIKICVDSTLHLDPGTSTETYRVDFSKVKNIADPTIREFLAADKNASEANVDSLQKNDSTWMKYGYFEIAAIRFESVETRNDNIIVHTAKIKAADGSNGTEMIFKRKGSAYKCLYSGITWIS